MINKILAQNPLFNGLAFDKIEEFLKNVGTYKRTFEKNEKIYTRGDLIDCIGIVLTGKVFIEIYDDRGNKSIISYIEQGGFFGETYALTGLPLMVDVSCMEKTEVLFINITNLTEGGYINNDFRDNLIKILAKKKYDFVTKNKKYFA